MKSKSFLLLVNEAWRGDCQSDSRHANQHSKQKHEISLSLLPTLRQFNNPQHKEKKQ